MINDQLRRVPHDRHDKNKKNIMSIMPLAIMLIIVTLFFSLRFLCVLCGSAVELKFLF
jgi:predicted nucleic acid-binding Zn ribbon protein